MSEHSTMPRATVVVPARDAESTIGECVRALQAQTIDSCLYELVVVDDGSKDRTAEIAQKLGATLICQPRSNPATALNTGLHAARGAIVCFAAADCIPRRDWLEQMLVPFQDPKVVGCKGVYSSRQGSLTARFVQVEYEDKYDLLQSQKYIDFIDIYSAAYRRDVLLANNGFDESFPFLEDQELSFRLAARGYRMVFQPNAIVDHHHAASVADYFRKKFIIGYWKAQVVRRFPGRGIRDSHTPQVIKLQMAIAGAALLMLALTFVSALSWVALSLTLLAFVVTAIPFLHKAWSKDRAVAVAAPSLLLVRALALGAGYAWGVVRPQPGISGTQSTIGGMQYVAKRALDMVGGFVGILLTLATGPFIALAIKLDSPGPVLFRQVRVGQGGKHFTIYKFRSMRHEAEKELDDLIALETLSEPVFKLEDDPRRTRVGRVLRRWSLDELPQFWNVFRGEMSLVGPRPEEVRVVAMYNDWHRRRLSIKPGLSGPMQVNGRADLSLDERVRLELDYIENYSLRRDLAIIARTLPAVLRGEGAW